MTFLDAPFDVFDAGPYRNGPLPPPAPPPAPPPGPPIRKLSTTIPVSREALEDAPYIRSMFEAAMRAGRLYELGFVGRVRCVRCRRGTRCLYRVGDFLYGRTCARRVLALLA